MPGNADVRVNINGRGRGQLVSSPRNGGPAVVRIEDSDGGAEVYQMEFTWTGGYLGQQQYPNRGNRARVAPEQAIENCRQAVRQQARNRFGTDNVDFRSIDVDNNPGRQDWVVGTVGVRQSGWNEELYPFSCSMNLNNGRVRRASIERATDRNNRFGSAGRDVEARVIDTCRSAVIGKVGNDQIQFGQMNVEDRSGDDLVHGTARSRGRDLQFTCSVNPYTGGVRTVDVRQR
jgi:hypothetical protein